MWANNAIVITAVGLYLAITWHGLVQMSGPSVSCDEHVVSCVHPLITEDEDIAARLFIQLPNETTYRRWHSVDTCQFNFTLQRSKSLPIAITNNDQNCTLALPEASRIRWSRGDNIKGGPLLGMLRLSLLHGPVIADVPLTLTRIGTRRSWASSSSPATSSRNLLDPLESSQPSTGPSKENAATNIPYFKYSSQPILLRYVADSASFAGGPPHYRGDGTVVKSLPWNHSAYAPVFYVDDNALRRSMQNEIAAPPKGLERPPVTIRIHLSAISPTRHVIQQQLTLFLRMAEKFLDGDELDEVRYWIRDEHIYRFILTQIISFTHLWLEYLAFRDEVRFFKGRQDMAGVSISSIITRLVGSLIIFLYLLDSDGTSWVILFGIASGLAVEAWKASRILRPSLSSSFPFIRIQSARSAAEHETAEYDRIATKWLSILIFPIMMGWAVVSLHRYEYKSWYSWLISNMANGVYAFGFIGMCPQLYVNYRLKSVAHLPWKVFLYKIFNTFVDDVFAFLIEMPWKHRVMTLRDDVVFALFLLQAWLYRVDKSRTNEFGYSYDDQQPDSSKEKIE